MIAILYDDAQARGWQPFALTRPAGELRYGAFTMRERLTRLTGLDVAGHLTAAHLQGFRDPDGAPVLAPDGLPDGALLLLSSRAVIDWTDGTTLVNALKENDASRGAAGTSGTSSASRDSAASGVSACARLLINGDPVGLIVPARAREARERLVRGEIPDPATWNAGADLVLRGSVLRHVWDLVAGSPEQTARDVEAQAGVGDASLPDGVHAFGSDRLVIESDVTVEPGVVFDRSHGPIWLRRGSTVRAFSRIAGPTVVDSGTTLLGGPYDAVSIGPRCKVHGEVEETVVLGYSNKAHDGFLGHAYVGRWVNLGALTTNSDLKNNYGTVRVDLGTGEQDTGIAKLGCFLGDHVKTGIGMMLNTGTVIGAGSMLYGSAMPPKHVPPFVWGTGDEWVSYRVDKFLDTARTVMGRRAVELDAANEDVLRRAWQQSADARGAESS